VTNATSKASSPGVPLVAKTGAKAIPVRPVAALALGEWLGQQDRRLERWVKSSGFTAKSGTVCLLPDADGNLCGVLLGVTDPEDVYALASLPMALPPGNYRVDAPWSKTTLERAAIGWALGGYQFTRYKAAKKVPAKLVIDAACDAPYVKNVAESLYLVRDLVNTPASDLMPEQLGQAAEAIAAEHQATVREIVGKDLLDHNYPAICAVGSASAHRPRLIDLSWGADPAQPKLTLVGKGVCFDSGGLDLKPAASMRLMKKDMGGAAYALGLARMIMRARLPVRLRVLIAAAENAVSGDAFRPGDILRTRQGLTVEVENTDAEGRVLLCDALTAAAAEQPDLILDFATLTGAARAALGTDLPALFCDSEPLAVRLLQLADQERDPMWRLPLYRPYRELLASKVADLANCSSGPYAGAITAALFLREFVPRETPWVHFDVMAWNLRSRPGRPEGGEAMGLRAVFAYLRERYPC
jgi:leucyl aminopeptidase